MRRAVPAGAARGRMEVPKTGTTSGSIGRLSARRPPSPPPRRAQDIGGCPPLLDITGGVVVVAIWLGSVRACPGSSKSCQRPRDPMRKGYWRSGVAGKSNARD